MVVESGVPTASRQPVQSRGLIVVQGHTDVPVFVLCLK